jgi:hypothetical protein
MKFITSSLFFLQLEVSFFLGKLRLFKENVDLCNSNKKAKDMTQIIVDAFGFVSGCPVANNKTVGCQKERSLHVFSGVGLNSIKSLFGGVQSDIKILANIEHDTGRTCFQIQVGYSGIPKRG